MAPLDRMASDLLDSLARELRTRSRVVLPPSDKTSAAVLVPLLATDEGVRVLFTRRSTALPQHQGQVAFPGGRCHADEVDAEVTALSEAEEEIGLDPADVRLLGRLDDIE